MFKENRPIYFLKDPSEPDAAGRIKLSQFAKTAGSELGDEIVVGGQTLGTRQQVKHVVDKAKEPNKAALCNITKKIDVSFDMPNNLPAVWDNNTNRMVLNAKVALANPEHIPFWVAHEASHGGLMKETQGAKITSEGLADFIAKRATGMDIGSDYSPELAKIEEIAKIIEESGAIRKDAGKAVINFNVKSDMEGLLKLLIRAFIKLGNSQEPINDAFRLFQAAFPKAQIMQTTPDTAEPSDY